MLLHLQSSLFSLSCAFNVEAGVSKGNASLILKRRNVNIIYHKH